MREQRDAIERYATSNGIAVTEWFEERETAATQGRLIFNAMLKRLQAGEAAGVIIHKIDRLARNLHDWSDAVDLIDCGIDIKLASGGIDLQSRGGRLSADIQAVVAADYSRNLREETRKGFYGRLKQGIYPLTAPIGYLNNGGGQLKTHDPQRAPLILEAFKLYATGNYTLKTLCKTLRARGLRSTGGRTVPINRLSEILNNPFYTGLIRIRTTGETFAGRHEPIVDQKLFNRVKAILEGRIGVRLVKNDFQFRRLIKCADCGFTLIGERQKGHVYYRCHSPSCRGVCIRQNQIDDGLRARLHALEMPQKLADALAEHLPQTEDAWGQHDQALLETLRAQLIKDKARFDRLTDALIDRLIDADTHKIRQIQLIAAINEAEQEIRKIETQRTSMRDTITNFLKLWKSLYSSYEMGNDQDRRDLLLTLTSNRLVRRKNLEIELCEPFSSIEKMGVLQKCGHHRNETRTFLTWLIDRLAAVNGSSSKVSAGGSGRPLGSIGALCTTD